MRLCKATPWLTIKQQQTRLFVLYSQKYAARTLSILFNTPKKSLLKSSYLSQIFVPQKIPESKISNPKKSFDHPRHLKSRVPPLGSHCLNQTTKDLHYDKALSFSGLFFSYRVFCLVGDAESSEGSIWEAMNFASYYKLDNLCAIFDVNRLGQSDPTMFEHDFDAYKRRTEAFG